MTEPFDPNRTYDSNFTQTLNYILEVEGGVSNHSADLGGYTNKGITQASYNTWSQANGRTPQDVATLSNAQVADFYYNDRYTPSGAGNLPYPLSLVVMDLSVNYRGPGDAQQFLNQALGRPYTTSYKEDPSAIAEAVNRLKSGQETAQSLALKLIDLKEAEHKSNVAKNPSQAVFLEGWLNRVQRMREIVKGASPGAIPTAPLPKGSGGGGVSLPGTLGTPQGNLGAVIFKRVACPEIVYEVSDSKINGGCQLDAIQLGNPLGSSSAPGAGVPPAGIKAGSTGLTTIVVPPGVKFANPAPGMPITSPFGPRWGRLHAGADFGCPEGTPVHAADKGVVIFAGMQPGGGGYGNMVDIEHDGSKGIKMTRYGHNSKLMVSTGDSVGQGQVISLSGNTGMSTGPHLHFQVHTVVTGSYSEGAIDPLQFSYHPQIDR
jgi:lysozyme family protein